MKTKLDINWPQEGAMKVDEARVVQENTRAIQTPADQPPLQLVADQRDLCKFVLEHAPYAIAFMGKNARPTFTNAKLCNWLNIPSTVLKEVSLCDYIFEEDRSIFICALRRVFSGKAAYHDVEVRLAGNTVRPRWVAVSLSKLPDPEKHCVVVHMADITRRKKHENELMSLATTDHLTTLSNRMVFEESLERAVKNARRYSRKGAILYIDIDDFKEVNDQYGHKAGDQILVEIGAACHRIFRETDVCARIGGDEFAIIMDEVTDVEAHEKAAQIEEAVKNICIIAHNKEVRTSVSVGVKIFNGDDVKAIEEIVMAADKAMYEAKAVNKNQRIV